MRDKGILLSLDISTKPGWAIFQEGKPIAWGTLFSEFTSTKLPFEFGTYPGCYIRWAQHIVNKIYNEVVAKYWPTQIVIEETASNSHGVYSQKILEFIHAELIRAFVVDQRYGAFNIAYVMTGQWRKKVEAQQNSEEKRLNSKISREKKKRNEAIDKDPLLSPEQKKKLKRLPIKIDGKVVGKKGRKHVSIRVASELMGQEFKGVEEDAVEAILLGFAWIRGAEPCDGIPGKKKQIDG